MKFVRQLVAACIACAAMPLFAQQSPVLFFGIMELSGTGATPGTNFNNGAKLAVKEINAAGGILGRPIDYTPFDTQTNLLSGSSGYRARISLRVEYVTAVTRSDRSTVSLSISSTLASRRLIFPLRASMAPTPRLV